MSATDLQQQNRPENNASGLSILPQRHGRKIILAMGILALIAIGIACYWYFFMRGIVFTDDARFNGHLVDLAPEINGRLIEVLVHEGQFVRQGQDIFRLKPETEKATMNQAEASLASTGANLLSNQAKYEKAINGSRPEEIKAAEAIVKRLQNEEGLARLELDRVLELKKQGAATQDKLDRIRTAHESARQNRENAVQNLAVLQQGSRKEDIEAAKAEVELARSRIAEAAAALDRTRQNWERCGVKAPFDGWIVRRWLDPGTMLLPGQPVVSLFDPSTLRVDANIEEKYLNEIMIGDKVEISVDAYPRLRLQGRVAEILRATNSKFSLIPAEGVSGTFIKVTQRVPLRILVAVPPDLPLGPGLSVEARIHAGSAAAAKSPRGHAGE